MKIAVYGATGHTGRLVVAELERRGLTPVAVARDGARLGATDLGSRGVATRVAATDDPVALARAFAGTAAVVNCAGPFLDTADAVASAALAAGSHYLDVTAEAASAAATLERWDASARASGLLVVPAMGFYGGLADLMATAATRGRAADEIRVGIALDSWHPTPGTRRTGERNNAPRMTFTAGRLMPLPQPPPETTWDFPGPFGHQDVVEISFSELVLITRHLQTSDLHTYLNRTPLRDLHDPTTPPPQLEARTGRSSQAFLVEVVVRAGDECRRIVVQGHDIYAVTAPLVAEAVERILAGRSGGSFAPGQIFEAAGFLASLDRDLLVWEGTSPVGVPIHGVG